MPGGAVGGDDLVVVSHVSPDAPGSTGTTVYLGHLVVEPYRHAPGLADLTDLEAQRVGQWCAAAARALRSVLDAEQVYSAVLGDRVPHLHVHVFSRHPGTPRQFWGQRVHDWPDAPQGDATQIARLVENLRAAITSAPAS